MSCSLTIVSYQTSIFKMRYREPQIGARNHFPAIKKVGTGSGQPHVPSLSTEPVSVEGGLAS